VIIFDTPRPCVFGRFRRTAHLMSTETGEAALLELDTFATSIGLRRSWRQKTGTEHEHFDLFDGAIERARAAGAVEVTGRELLAQGVYPKRAALSPSQPAETEGAA
jgi:uncharacterized protein DUF4031